jgi:hypothetical protein
MKEEKHERKKEVVNKLTWCEIKKGGSILRTALQTDRNTEC